MSIQEIRELLDSLERENLQIMHQMDSLRSEIDGLRIELNYLRNENITLRSNQ